MGVTNQIQYWRDFFDGTKQIFEGRLERPAADQLYYDDAISNRGQDASLSFLHFGKEQSYPNREFNRTSVNYILHYVTDGFGVFNGKRIGAGEGFLVIPDVPHHMMADPEQPWHFKWISFGGSEARWHMKSIGLDEENQYFFFSFASELEGLFDDVLYREHTSCDLNTYMQGVFYMILSYHKKQYLRDRQGSGAGVGYAREAIRYIDEHFCRELRIDEVAEALHISRKYLCTVLEQYIGMPTKEYLLTRRLEAASRLLLSTELSVSEIAQKVGYDDYTQLSRLFRKKKGVSPTQYRKRNRDGEVTSLENR